MPVPVPAELLDFIRGGITFIVAGHEEPDGDCVGSQLAVTSVLRRMGKKAYPCSAGPFKRTEIKPFEKYFVPCPDPARNDSAPRFQEDALHSGDRGTRVLVMDCSTRDRVGKIPIDGLPLAVVDHHLSGSPWGDVIYLDPGAPSVTLMAAKLIGELGFVPTPEEAELLLFGLCTDTGFFRHLDEGSAEAFETAAALTAAGASPKKIFAAINGGKSLNSRLLMGRVLANTRSYYGGRLLVSGETLEETEQFGRESRDSDTIYQLLLSVEGVEAVGLLRQENPGECTIGLRSRNRIDVAAVAEQFGGGGHKNASGAKTAGTIPLLEEKLTAAFAPWFS
ncbi:MAG: bifunctional oligoribonuclease/PAP phosphatase NrnA [Spirochaetaceae bacterium]|jgi:phosphoesterase RecJ-like protein|nr:bifunctional oligoribonuclease/PAP phosphatase NrnA [Spirochaetaceae bacterium]